MNDGAPAAPTPSVATFHEYLAHQASQAEAQSPPPAKPAARPANGAARQAPTPDAARDLPTAEDLDADAGVEPDEPTLDGGDEDVDPAADAPPDLLETDYHGKKGREILEALARGELPDELLEHLKIKMKFGDSEELISVHEARLHRMRMSDYTRSKQEAKAETQRARGMVDSVRGMIDGWKTGEDLRRGMKLLGKSEAFRQAALAEAREAWEDDQMRANNPEAWQARQDARKAQERAEELEQQMRRRPQSQQPDERTHAFAQQLEAAVVPAFKAAHIKDTPFARARFGEHFRELYDESADLQQVVRDAVTATAEQLSDLALRFKETQDAKQPPKPALPPASGRPGSPRAPTAPRRAERLTPDQMARRLRGA